MKKNDETVRAVHDYILLMLGSPVVKIELDSQNLDHAVKVAANVIRVFGEMSTKTLSDEMQQKLLQEGAFAYAELMLGHIRRKYSTSVESEGFKCSLDGQQLVNEGLNAIQIFENNVKWAYGIK